MSERILKHSTIVVERNFKAARARVFASWAEPDTHRRWKVPCNDREIEMYENDFRVGTAGNNSQLRGNDR
jgi:uncharacterized protein YndB with AHSA1/START domain